jgi:Domain of unknown function (DUF5615)
MRILFDENVPRQLRGILTGHDVRTTREMGWARYSNGQLLDEAEKAGFGALVSADQGFPSQQNIASRTIAVIVLCTTDGPSFALSLAARNAPSPMPHRAPSPSPPFTARADPGGRPLRRADSNTGNPALSIPAANLTPH